MTGFEDSDRLRRVLAFRRGGEAEPTPRCLEDDLLAALAEGTLDAEARSAALAHVATCLRCRRAVASVARALADPQVERETPAAARKRHPRVHWLGGAGLAAAAAAVLLLVVPPLIDEPSPPHRAAPVTAAPAPEAVWPVGTVAEARSIRWTAVSGADRYRVTLFDTDGVVRYETEVTGTVAALPDSALPVPGETYWWKVDARLGFDRWASSELTEFSVGRTPPR